MTNEQKLELVRKAMEKGANISISFYSEKDAVAAENLLKELGVPDMKHKHREGTYWVIHQDPEYRFDVSAFYKGEEEPLPFADEDFLVGEELEV